LGALVDAETGVRGYDLNQDPTFLETYHVAKGTVPDSIAALKKLVRADPQQKAQAGELERLAQERMNLLAADVHTVAESVKGTVARDALTNSRMKGKLVMDAF